jgi:hypothetical protein
MWSCSPGRRGPNTGRWGAFRGGGAPPLVAVVLSNIAGRCRMRVRASVLLHRDCFRFRTFLFASSFDDLDVACFIVASPVEQCRRVLGCCSSVASTAVALPVRWSCFTLGFVSSSADWDDVVEGECLGVQGWEFHVDGVAAEPADGELGVVLQVSAFAGDASSPGVGSLACWHGQPLPTGLAPLRSPGQMPNTFLK